MYEMREGAVKKNPAARVTLQSRVAAPYGSRFGVTANRCHGLGVRTVRLEPQGGDFFVEGAGAKTSRLILRRLSVFSKSLPIPADASGAYRPNPQAKTKPAPGHP